MGSTQQDFMICLICIQLDTIRPVHWTQMDLNQKDNIL